MKNANNLLEDFSGTENYYRHSMSNLFYTDGVQHAMETMKCYWFTDLVMSYQTKAFREKNEFQVWILMRQKDESFIAICEDGDNNKLLDQKIPFSDFEHDTLTYWLVDGVLLLPSEY